MPNQLSKASEQRLLDALEKTATLISAGEHPNDAITKVAEQAQIPSGHIHLMVNAVNTGRTNAHRQLTNDPREKAAEFPLADASTVLERLYPATIRTKAANYEETAISSEYTKPPRFLDEKRRMEKAARVIDWRMTDKKLEIRTDPDKMVKQAWGQIRRLEIDVEDKRRAVAVAREQAIKLAHSLREYFKQPGHVSYPEVAENAQLLFGKQASIVLATITPNTYEKAAKVTTPVDTNKAPYSLIHAAIKLAQSFKASQEAYKAAVATAQHDTAELLRPFVPGPERGHSVMANLSSLTKVAVDDEAPTTAWEHLAHGAAKGTERSRGIIGAFGNVVRKGFGLIPAANTAKEVGKRMGGGGGQRDKSDMLADLTDPAHEMEIRNIQSEALLNDLMANDDVVRGHDPESVIDAYNEIAQIAPYAATNKIIMRDLLRKHLGSGGVAIDNFVTGDVLNSQQKLKEQHSIPETSLTTMKDMGVLPGVSQTHAKSVLAK